MASETATNPDLLLVFHCSQKVLNVSEQLDKNKKAKQGAAQGIYRVSLAPIYQLPYCRRKKKKNSITSNTFIYIIHTHAHAHAHTSTVHA